MTFDALGRRCQHEPVNSFPTFRVCLQSVHGKWIWVCCPVREYNHSAAVAYATFAIRWGMTATTYMIRRCFRCSRCGNLGALIRAPSWSVERQFSQALLADRALQIHSPDAWLERMCNLYSLNSTREGVGRLFKVSHNRMGHFPEQLTLFQGRDSPVVRLAEDGEREMVNMNWGFVLLQNGLAPRRVTNTRDDKMKAPFWKQSLDQRRCLVPVTSFAESDGGKPAQWHWFALQGDQPRPLFAFAGLWRRWKGPVKKDGPTVEIDTYSFMTTRPNKFTEAINHDRLPAILATPEDQETWLWGNDDHSLLKPYPASKMREVQVGFDKFDRMEMEEDILQPMAAPRA
jgi:putative SOS response-associated peptidase YedK